ncbi:hypothetical protein EH2_04083 [Bacillus subtilis]|nr:hypothetical protein BSSX_0383 [Bacillus subtilis]RPK13209.1 hypothetical protein EH2_04083 [Bacillus subtilis]
MLSSKINKRKENSFTADGKQPFPPRAVLFMYQFFMMG